MSWVEIDCEEAEAFLDKNEYPIPHHGPWPFQHVSNAPDGTPLQRDIWHATECEHYRWEAEATP